MGDQWGSWDESEDDQRDDLGDESPTYLDALDDEDVDDLPESPLFTVTNPPEMVTVTATIDGGIRQVELAPSVVKMTEYELADEIRAIAKLATMKAGSVVHAFLVEGLRSGGHDAALTSSTLSRGLGMLSPKQAAEATRRVFEERYGRGSG
jgi:hypothetical protein